MHTYESGRTGRLAGIAQSLLRIVAGLLFLQHGGMKMLGWFGGMGNMPVTAVTRAAGTIEMVAGTLILVGLLTRPFAFLASGEMAFAYFMAHFPRGFFPIQNQGEPAVLFCFIFLFFSAAGAGPWSLDHLLARRGEPLGAMASDRPLERTATR